MKQWIQSWNLIRLLRLALAITIIYQGIDLEQWLFVAIGGLLALMPLSILDVVELVDVALLFLNQNRTKKQLTQKSNEIILSKTFNNTCRYKFRTYYRVSVLAFYRL